MKTLLILIVLIISSAIFSWGFSGKELNYFRTECSIKQIETDTLIYQKWILTKLNGMEDVKEKAGKNIPYLEFHLKDNKLSGYTGCNSIKGLAIITEDEIAFSGISTTKMECKNDKFDKYEMEFDEIIFYDQPFKYKIENGVLTIFKRGKEVMALEMFGNNSTNSQVTDVDGNVYKTLKIGEQEWMAENLNVSHYRNGDIIRQMQNDTEWTKFTTGGWCYYQNGSANVKTYGKLYNWYAVNDIRGLAPKGWHIASDKEWIQLIDYLGGEETAGGKLKASILWEIPNEDASNESGFSALPGGMRLYNGYLFGIGYYACFWSSSEDGNSNAWNRYLGNESSKVNRYSNYKQDGMSVRCVKD